MSGKIIYTCETCFKRGEVNVKGAVYDDWDEDGIPLPEDFWDADTCDDCYDLFYFRLTGEGGWAASSWWANELSGTAAATVLSDLIDRSFEKDMAVGDVIRIPDLTDPTVRA